MRVARFVEVKHACKSRPDARGSVWYMDASLTNRTTHLR
jgi:hypothetical protein